MLEGILLSLSKVVYAKKRGDHSKATALSPSLLCRQGCCCFSTLGIGIHARHKKPSSATTTLPYNSYIVMVGVVMPPKSMTKDTSENHSHSKSHISASGRMAIRTKPWVVILVLALVSMIYSTRKQCQLELTISSRPSAAVSTRVIKLPPSPIDHKRWCPDADCKSSPMCQPCQRRFLIVITNGRSASTTLTWMLDLLPGLRMGGENNNALQNIMTMIQSTTKPPFQLVPGKQSKQGAWDHNPIPPGALACPAQSMIETIIPPKRWNATHMAPGAAKDIIGFKTIRLVRNNTLADLPAIAKFLKAHFPCTRYIINYRSDFAQQAMSQMTALPTYRQQDKANLSLAVERLKEEVNRLKIMANLLGQSAIVIDGAKWTQDVQELNKAVTWLGFSEYCAFPALLELNTGGRSSGSNSSNSNHRNLAVSKPAPQRLKATYGQRPKRPSPGGKAYQHSVTTLELDPRCRYVG